MTTRFPISRRRFLTNTLIAGGASLLTATRPLSAATPLTPPVRLGIDVMERSGFIPLRRKRVGLLTHPAGVNRLGVSTIEVLRRSNMVNLVALFGPEHGIYGNEKANVPVDDKIDPRTGLPVYSLYGKFRRPTAAMLGKIDAMVIDLQDIGSRSYTYVSCMLYVMEECFKAGKEVIVLDRPNPLGGLKLDGPHLDPEWRSYVGAFPVPYVHGLTIGELATMAHKQPGVMQVSDAVRRGGRLQVISMSGWHRAMMWPDTGLQWIPTSPAIPDLSAVLGYPMTGLGSQLGSFSHGYGSRLPFRMLQFTGKAPEDIASTLSARRIPGLDFTIVPFEINGQRRRATYVQVLHWEHLRPTELSLHMMVIATQWQQPNPFAAASQSQRDLFTKHVGDPRVMQGLLQISPQTSQAAQDHFIRTLISDWAAYCSRFAQQRVPWLLYA